MTNGEMKLNFEWLPPEVKAELRSFARNTLGVTLEEDWEETYPCIPGDVWAPFTDDLIAFLRGLRRS